MDSISLDFNEVWQRHQTDMLESAKGFELLLFPTSKCRLKCGYCTAKREGPDLDLARLDRFMDRVKVSKIKLYGGEGFLADGMEGWLRHRRVPVEITTSFGFSDEEFERFALFCRKTAVNICISIDPPNSMKKSDDYPDWYSESVRRASHIPYSRIKCTVSPNNPDFRRVRLDLNSNEDFYVSPAYGAAFSAFDQTVLETEVELDASSFPVNSPNLAYLDYARFIDDRSFHLSSCDGLLTKLHVGQDGTVGFCYCGKEAIGTLEDMDEKKHLAAAKKVLQSGCCDKMSPFKLILKQACLRIVPDEVIRAVCAKRVAYLCSNKKTPLSAAHLFA